MNSSDVPDPEKVGPAGSLVSASPALPAVVPKAPEGLTAEVRVQIESEVASLANTINASLSNRNFMMTLDNVGRPEQELASQRIELIETRVNALTKTETAGAKIPAVVSEMRTSIDQLNPKRIEQSRFGQWLARLPGGQPILEMWWASGLRQITIKRETIREQIKGIKEALLGNKSQLLGDNGQLNQLYGYVSGGAMVGLQKTAYMCELLLEKLQQSLLAMPPDDPRRDRLQGAIEKITVRVRHMRQTENALQQALATIDITLDGNVKIAESLDETAMMTTSYLTVAMALYQALAHQQQAIQALVKAREGTADVMIKTSEMARASAETVSELYFNPAAELAKVEQAQANLMAALGTLEEASRDGVVAARQGITKLRAMTETLREREAHLRATRELGEGAGR
jgi:uncharacterized protein YaaN involved in tellurite resistance